MESKIIPKEYDKGTIEHIFENAFGNPVIFSAVPTSANMKSNTWGKVKDATDYLYIKFADGKTLRISATEIT